MRPHVMRASGGDSWGSGDRDRAKRPLMGQGRLRPNSIWCLWTDDNRAPEDSRKASVMPLMKAAPDATEVGGTAPKRFLRGIDAIGAGDALLIAGKGTWNRTKPSGTMLLPFDDVEQASVSLFAALDGRLAMSLWTSKKKLTRHRVPPPSAHGLATACR